MLYLKDVVSQLASTVKDSGIDIQRASNNRNNGNLDLLMSVISMGLYPDIGMRKKGANAFKTEKGRKAKVHASSINTKGKGAYPVTAKVDIEFIGYQDLISSTGGGNIPGAGK
jgi:hypothetical protein